MHLGSNFKSDENSDEKFLGNSELSNTDPKALGSGEAMAGNNRSNPYDQSSYDQVPPPGNPTYSEAWALVEAARRMAAPLEYGAIDDPENLRKIRDGLRLNWRLWTIFQTELSLEEASVPENIRENMLSLSHFVDQHTVETLSETTPERVATLIELNRQIANGLLSSLQNETEETEIISQGKNIQDAQNSQPSGPMITSIDTDA